MDLAGGSMNRQASGFTLVEMVVALTLAAILAAMVSSALNQGLVSGEALVLEAEQHKPLISLRRLLHRDIKSRKWGSDIVSTSSGFKLTTTHNLLRSAPIPVEVEWIFDREKIIRREENPDLDYSAGQVLSRRLQAWELSFYSRKTDQWIEHSLWNMDKDRPAPDALALSLTLTGHGRARLIENIPSQTGPGVQPEI